MREALSKLTRFKRHLPLYLANGATDLIVMVFGFVSGVLVARALGPEGRGQLAAAVMWPSLAATLACFGIQHAIGYATAAGWCSPRRVDEFAIRYAVMVGVPVTVLFGFTSPLLFARSFPGESWIPLIFALSIPISMYASFLMPLYQGLGDFKRWNHAKLIRNGGWAIGVILLLVARSANVVSLLVVQLVVLVAFAAFLSGGWHRKSPIDDRPVPIKKLVRYGFAVYLSGLAYMVNQQLDQLLLSLWVAPEDLGQYAAAVTVAGLLLVVTGAISPVLFRQMVHERGNRALQAEVVREGLFLICLIVFPVAAFVTWLAPSIVSTLYGDAFSEAGKLLRIMAPAAVLLGIGDVFATILRAAGRPMLATYGIGGGVLITVPGLVYALPRYGVSGAAWVSLSTYAAMALLQGVFVWDQLRNQVVVPTPQVSSGEC